MLWRAFDKTVRRKPLAFAADAVGLWELNVGGVQTPLMWEGQTSGPDLGVRCVGGWY